MFSNTAMQKIWLSLFLLLLAVACSSENNQTAEDNSQDNPVEGEDVTAVKVEKKKILIFGNSLTAGLGVEPEEAFPAILQTYIDSLELPYEVVSAGVSGETSAGGETRITWMLRQPVDIFLLELGANDGLRGINLEATRQSLKNILDQTKQAYPEVQLMIAGMLVPPNMGPEYSTEFQKIWPELADTYQASLVPFLLEGVAGEPDLNQDDGIHPTPEGHQMVADNVWAILKDLL
ncbi:MAG: arylesterase [Bacteroidota bacterium]